MSNEEGLEKFRDVLTMAALVAMHARIMHGGLSSREQMAELCVKDACAVIMEVDHCIEVSTKKTEAP